MIVAGPLVGVEEKPEGSAAAAAASAGATSVVVDNGNHFREFGICQIGDASYVYTLGEDDVTLTLDDPLAADVEIGDLVLSLTDTALSESQVFAFVQLEDNQPPARAVVPSAMRTLALSDSLLIGGLTQLNTTPDGYEVRSLPFDKPTLDTITGTLIRTAESGQRMELTQDTYGGTLRGYSGEADETWPGEFAVVSTSDSFGSPYNIVNIRSGFYTVGGIERAQGRLGIYSGNENQGSGMLVEADSILFEGDTKIGAGSSPINGLRFGRRATSTDASSVVTVTHGLGVTPSAVFVTVDSPARQLTVDSYDATTITLRARDTAGALFGAGQTVNFFWLVLR